MSKKQTINEAKEVLTQPTHEDQLTIRLCYLQKGVCFYIMDRVYLKNAIVSLMGSGGLLTPELLLIDSTKDKPPKRVQKAIKASSQYRLVDGLIKAKNNKSVPAVAFWDQGFHIIARGEDVRFWILVIQCGSRRYFYGIPAQTYLNLRSLPNCGFSPEEVKLLLNMADTVNGNIKKKEELLCVNSFAFSTIESQRSYWLSRHLDRDTLYHVLASTALNWEILAAIIDAQFPALGDVSGVPRGVTNFIIDPSDEGGRQYVQAVSDAVTFSNEPSQFRSGVMDLSTLGKHFCRNYPERVTMMRVQSPGNKSCLPSITEQVAQADMSQMAGNFLQSAPAESPLFISDAAGPEPYVYNILVPDGLEPPTGETLDLLRTAASRLVCCQTLYWCRERWIYRMAQPDAYRINPFHEWRRIIKDYICDVLFRGSAYYDQVRNMMEHGIGKLESDNERRLARIIEYYRQTDHY